MPGKTKGDRSGPQRVGDIRGEAPTNLAVDSAKAAKMASLLEGLDFPATKKEILHFINRRLNHKKRDKDVGDIINRIQHLDDKKRYDDTFEIGQVLGLVRHVYTGRKPYVRDRALNLANKQRLGEQLRPDPYFKRNNRKRRPLV